MSTTVVSEAEGFVRATIRPEDVPRAMRMFSSQYTRPIEAAIRETGTNAQDAQAANGHTGPVEFRLPTAWDRWFTVTDHGIGMSLTDIVEVYGNYVASTKRDDPAYIGELGIGSKAIFAVADHYEITTVKDGVLLVVEFALDEYRVPMYRIVDEEATDLPSGTTVRIPLADDASLAEWTANLQKVVYWWDRGTALVDGEAPDEHYTDGFGPVQDQVRFPLTGTDGRILQWDRVVRMGQTAYQIPNSFLWSKGDSVLRSLKGFVLEMPAKSLEVTIQREDIADTPANKQTVLDIILPRVLALKEDVVRRLEGTSKSLQFLREFAAMSTFEKDLSGNSHLGSALSLYGRVERIEIRCSVYLENGNGFPQQHLFAGELVSAQGTPVTFVEGDLDTPLMKGLVQRWRRANGKKPFVLVEDRKDLEPLVDPDELDWYGFDDLRAEIPSAKKKAPAPIVPLKDTDKLDVWVRSGFRKEFFTVADIKALAADGQVLMIGPESAYRGNRLYDVKRWGVPLLGDAGLKSRLEDALGAAVALPDEALLAHVAEGLVPFSDEQLQRFVERAVVPPQSFGTSWAILHDEERRKALPKKIRSVLDEFEAAYVSIPDVLNGRVELVTALPGAPASVLAARYPMVVELLSLGASVLPSAELLQIALRSDDARTKRLAGNG